ncbi:bacteriochlorophyll synthase 33 kDa chain [alpha proteobacterium Q-1]|nr:chlorophyll synthase ChlG [Iodidimonas nitroreducens]GAK32648.1 bacteriochlorophyll synthase 33 kDa chain [alpha proteobacterium Q-1]
MSRFVPSAALELLKPITWFAPMWAYMCGIISSGVALSGHWLIIGLGVLLAGPMVCGTSQAVNDWFDRHVDQINQPERPIPSGRIPGSWGLIIAVIWTVLSVILATFLGLWGFLAALFGLALAWAYSAPPFRLKRNGWWGNAAVGLCYEGLPWFTGAAIMAAALPGERVLLFAGLYSLGAHGIMTLNDFKSVEGDLKMGIASLPAQMGVDRAARFACIVMLIPQLVVAALLWFWQMPIYAATLGLFILVQLVLMRRLLQAPRLRAPWYNATGTSLYVGGMLLAAFALRASSIAGEGL